MNADMVIQTERMPLMGETIRGGGFRVNPGGKGANQAAALAKLGGCVKMMGCVGADMYGDMMRQSLTQYGVQTGRRGDGHLRLHRRGCHNRVRRR